MSGYTIFHALIFSFFSGDFYRAVALRWRGIGFWYLALLLLATSIPLAASFWVATSKLDRKTLEPITSRVPRIEIRNGEAKVDGPQPIFIADPETGKTVVIIDTTGRPHPDLDKMDQVLVLTKTKIIVKQPGQERSFPLRELEPFLGNPAVIDKQWIENTVFWWVNLMNILVLPFFAVFAFLYRFIEQILLGLLALLIGSSKRPRLGFAQSLRLAAMALTPVVLLNTAYELVVPAVTRMLNDPRAQQVTGAFQCVWWLICIAIPILYVIFGVMAATKLQSATGEHEMLRRDFREDDDLDLDYQRRP